MIIKKPPRPASCPACMQANWIKIKLPFGKNDRLHEYLRNDREEMTLLKLLSIEELQAPMKLGDFVLWNGRHLKQPPQGCYRIRIF